MTRQKTVWVLNVAKKKPQGGDDYISVELITGFIDDAASYHYQVEITPRAEWPTWLLYPQKIVENNECDGNLERKEGVNDGTDFHNSKPARDAF